MNGALLGSILLLSTPALTDASSTDRHATPASHGQSMPSESAGQNGPLGKSGSAKTSDAAFKTLTREMKDGVVMTADSYAGKSAGPIVVCFHMAHSSRGEYRDIAPELVKLGCSVLAVDQRCGGAQFGVENETARSCHKKTGKQADFADAYGDIAFALAWARELAPAAKVVMIGSSYSASLVLVQAGREPKSADLVLSFSPGEYIAGWSIATEAKKIAVPTYITCGMGKREQGEAKPIADAVDARWLTVMLPPNEVSAAHGSRTLMVDSTEDRQTQWEPVKKLIGRLKP